MVKIWWIIAGLAVIGSTFGILSFAENYVPNPPNNSTNFPDLNDTFMLMKALGFFAGITLIVIGLFRSKNNPTS